MPAAIEVLAAIGGVSGALGGIASVYAVRTGRRALQVSKTAQEEAAREHARTDARQRLMYLHTVLNALDKLDPNARPEDYASDRQWLRTMLALAGRKRRLPLTVAISDMTQYEAQTRRFDVKPAWQEVLKELELRGDRAHADETFSTW